MYTFESDRSTDTLVGIYHGGLSTDGDFQACAESLSQLMPPASGRLPLIVLIVDAGHSPPSATWRRRMAERRESYGDHRFALVTRSTIARGVMTAIQWLKPALRHQTRAFSDFAAAREWLERESRAAAPMLDVLHGRARARALRREAESAVLGVSLTA